MAADSSLVVRIMASRQGVEVPSPVIQATSLVDPSDQVQVDNIAVLPHLVSPKTNRDLLKRLQDRLVVQLVNQLPHHARPPGANNNKQELVLLWLEHHQCSHLRLLMWAKGRVRKARHSLMRSNAGSNCLLTGKDSHLTGSGSSKAMLKTYNVVFPQLQQCHDRLRICLRQAQICSMPWWNCNDCVQAVSASSNDGSSRLVRTQNAIKKPRRNSNSNCLSNGQSDRMPPSSELRATLQRRTQEGRLRK